MEWNNNLRSFVLLVHFVFRYYAISAESMKAVLFTPGGPESMYIGDAPRPKLKETEVLIRVHFTALNRADTLQRKGSYPPPPGESEILGLEVSGIVEELGSACNLGWRKGDKVMALVPGGGYAEFAAVQESHVMPIPKGMSQSDAATIPEVWLTSFQLLHLLGDIQQGDKVLIHAGGSGVGTASVQLVRLAGGVPYVTAGSQKKIQAAMDLGAEGGFNYKEGDFSDWALEVTGGEGMDLITDCVGGSYWQQNIKALATDGRWILYGLLGGPNVDGNLLGQVLRKRVTLKGTTLRTRSIKYKAKLVKAFTEAAIPHFSSGELKPLIDSILPMDRIQEAHTRMEQNLNTGKIVIRVASEKKAEL
ncbi:quinone oxidoreductase PIG3 isoform X2 [Nematostella vectensis]|nr:quinone oxidoreductase PIG3 isoform X2 [Nematostella vectensis]